MTAATVAALTMLSYHSPSEKSIENPQKKPPRTEPVRGGLWSR